MNIGIYIEGDVPGYASDLGHLSRVEDINKNVELTCLQVLEMYPLACKRRH